MKTAPLTGTPLKMTEKLEAYSLLTKFVSLKINKKLSKGDISLWTCIKSTRWSGTLKPVSWQERQRWKDEKLLELSN